MTNVAPRALVYSKTYTHCPYCVKAKALLEKHGITYEEKSVEDNREECFARVREATGADPKTAPQIFIDGKHVGGYDQLVPYLEANLVQGHLLLPANPNNAHLEGEDFE